MDKKQVYDRMVNIVEGYIEDFDSLGPDPQIRINPVSGMIEVDNAAERDIQIDESDATLEATTDAEGLASQDGMDWQTAQNPRLVALRTLIRKDASGRVVADTEKIRRIVATLTPVNE